MEQKFEGINKSKIIGLDKEKQRRLLKHTIYNCGIILFLILFNSFTFTVDEQSR